MTCDRPVLYVILPCWNEEDVLPITAPVFISKLSGMVSEGLVSERSRILFVNDGSTDATWDIIKKLSSENETVEGICLSRNRGQQNALAAGYAEVTDRCDIAISADCDGQDDIGAMDLMVREYMNGAQIVYGVRSDRSTDSFLKRSTARGFYRFMERMGAETVYDHAEYRLVSSEVLRAFSSFEEVNLYLRGMFPLVGFKSTSVYYERHERMAGKTHYDLKRMLSLAMDGITSLSVKPLRLIFSAGVLMLVSSLIMLIILLIAGAEGWQWVTGVLLLTCGLQLIALGIIGEYTGKTYMETKHRPRFIISERTEDGIK